MLKNTASQKLAVVAWDTAAQAFKTGDAANITANVFKDGGAAAASNDVNPTELDATNAPGVYLFDMTQAETNCDLLILKAVSATADILIEPVMIYTRQDVLTRLGTPAGASVSVDVAAVKADTAAILTDTGTTLDARLPAALVGGRMDANVGAVSGSATAADNLEAGALGIVSSSALTGTLTTTAMTTNLTEATNDHYNGRVIVWTSGVLAGEAREILDYDGATKKLTYSTTTDAPSNGDTFVIV